MALLSVGTMALDTVATPTAKRDFIVGGTNSYIALAASFFTRPVQLVSVIGNDFPSSFLDKLNEIGADMEGVEKRADEKSFFWEGRYHDDMMGRDTLDTQLNCLATFNPSLPAAYKQADYVMLGNLTPAIQASVLDQLESEPKLVALDTMNFWMDTAMDDLKQVVKRIDVLIINDEEARQFSGERSLVKAAKVIKDMGVPYLIIKKGEHGALLFHGEQVFFAPALPLAEVFDPTGAGDTFAGGFMGYMAACGIVSFEMMKRAIIFGSALASFTVEDFGPERLMNLTRKEVDARAAKFLELTSFSLEHEVADYTN